MSEVVDVFKNALTTYFYAIFLAFIVYCGVLIFKRFIHFK